MRTPFADRYFPEFAPLFCVRRPGRDVPRPLRGIAVRN